MEPQHRPNDEGEQWPPPPRESGDGGARRVPPIGACRGGDTLGRASREVARGGTRDSRALEGHGVGRRGRGGWGRVRLRSYGGGAQGGGWVVGFCDMVKYFRPVGNGLFTWNLFPLLLGSS